MYIILKQIHFYTAYLALFLLLHAIFHASLFWFQKKLADKPFKISMLVSLISLHLQLIIGIVLYFISPMGADGISAQAMKDTTMRLYILEHPLAMLVAITLITIGYSKSKRSADNISKYKSIVLYYSIALAIILLRIPWKSIIS